MKIADMPWFTRPNIRLKRQGAQSLSDAELLAIIIGRGNRKENAVDLSNRILNMFNLKRLSSLSFVELNHQIDDEIKSMKIIAMFELFRRTQKLEDNGFKQKISTAQDVYNRFCTQLRHEK